MGLSCVKLGRHHLHQHHYQQQQQQQQHLPLPQLSSVHSSTISPQTLPPSTSSSPPPPPPPPRHNSTSETHTEDDFDFDFDFEHYRNTLPQPNSGGRSNNPNRSSGRSGTVAPYVDNRSVKKIKNDVNVHRNSVRVELDEKNLDAYLVSFTFDALADGSITIFYFAKEGANCTMTPLCPEMLMPLRFPFEKGLGQKFCQPSGTGISLGFLDIEDLLKPSLEQDVFPLVISAETSLPFLPLADHRPYIPTAFPHAQITQAVIEKKNEGTFQVKVVNQILWVDGIRYELREIYGISESVGTGFNDNELGKEKECIICMTEPKTAAILPCRHLCLCSECAKEIRFQSNKCPICRQPIEELLEIQVNKESS